MADIPYNDHLLFSLSDPSETELVIVSVFDTRTGYTVRTALPNSGLQSASLMAFAGARYSRSDLSVPELFQEIKSAGTNAQERLAAIFRNYGHASVADMAQLFAYIENVPQIHALRFFYETSVGGGQERSTRYQDFGGTELLPLENLLVGESRIEATSSPEYEVLADNLQHVQKLSYDLYNKWTECLTARFSEVYGVDQKKKGEVIALKARVFDTARAFLLSGCSNTTSLAWVTSAREWARVISLFKAQIDQRLVCLAEQLEALFAPDPAFANRLGYVPEAPDLIRYTSADETTASSLERLRSALSSCGFPEYPPERAHGKRFDLSVQLFGEEITLAQKVLLQNVLCLYPLMDEEWFFRWENTLEYEQTRELGKALTQGYNHHRQMGNSYRVNGFSFLIDTSLAEMRDLNRHRAWGRFAPLLSATRELPSLLKDGYILPAYLSDNPALTGDKELFEKDLASLYELVTSFVERACQTPWFPSSLAMDLLPFAHRARFWMHGSVKEVDYLTKLRVRPGGHINYRITAHQIAQATASHSPLLSGMAFTDQETPRPEAKEQFVDRS